MGFLAGVAATIFRSLGGLLVVLSAVFFALVALLAAGFLDVGFFAFLASGFFAFLVFFAAGFFALVAVLAAGFWAGVDAVSALAASAVACRV